MDESKLYFFCMLRPNFNSHPIVHSAGPYEPGKMHNGVGVEVGLHNTEEMELGHIPGVSPSERVPPSSDLHEELVIYT